MNIYSTFPCHIFTLAQADGQVMTFRNLIRMMALVNIKGFLGKFKDLECIEAYVKSGLIYHGEIPFLYCVFKPSDVPSPKEKGGYKVVSRYPSLLTKQPRTHSLLDLQWTFSKLTDFQNHAYLLWETRHKGIPANGSLLGRKEPCWGSCAYLHCSKNLKHISSVSHF